MNFFSLVISSCLFLCMLQIDAQQNGDATSLNPSNFGQRPLIQGRVDEEPSKIVGGTQTLVGINIFRV